MEEAEVKRYPDPLSGTGCLHRTSLVHSFHKLYPLDHSDFTRIFCPCFEIIDNFYPGIIIMFMLVVWCVVCCVVLCGSHLNSRPVIKEKDIEVLETAAPC